MTPAWPTSTATANTRSSRRGTPSNAKDNSQSGYTGNVYVDAYKIDGTKLWRIDLGRNIRAGAHYTQLLAYDFDGDGKAELSMKTADGTKDAAGTVIGDPAADYRNTAGYVLSGPEFLTVFKGETGTAMDTVAYDPPRGSVAAWGDGYGNRVDRFLGGVAYLDGEHPSHDVQPRLLHAHGPGHVRPGRRQAGEALEVRFRRAGAEYKGQGNHNLVGRRRRPGRQGRVRLRLHDHRRRRHAALQHQARPRRRHPHRATWIRPARAWKPSPCTKA